MGKLYFVGFLFSLFNWTTQSELEPHD